MIKMSELIMSTEEFHKIAKGLVPEFKRTIEDKIRQIDISEDIRRDMLKDEYLETLAFSFVIVEQNLGKKMEYALDKMFVKGDLHEGMAQAFIYGYLAGNLGKIDI